MRIVEAYTDGACSPNPGIGGWGWVTYQQSPNNISTSLSMSDHGGKLNTTNQQMELTAMAEFLESCPKGNKFEIHVYTDSDYVLGGIVGKNIRELNSVPRTEFNVSPHAGMRGLTRVEPLPQGWMRGWSNVYNKLGTTFSDTYWKKDVKNDEQWYRIHQALLSHAQYGTILMCCWVKGH